MYHFLKSRMPVLDQPTPPPALNSLQLNLLLVHNLIISLESHLCTIGISFGYHLGTAAGITQVPVNTTWVPLGYHLGTEKRADTADMSVFFSVLL